MKEHASQPCKLTFKLDRPVVVGAKITLNGEPIENIISGFHMTAKAGEIVRIVLDVIPTKMDIDLEKALVTMKVEGKEYRLVEMGPTECDVEDATALGDTVRNFRPKEVK